MPTSSGKSKYPLPIVGWLVCALAIATLLGRLNATAYVRLVREGQRTTGAIIGREPANHDSVTVRYRVMGGEYVLGTSFVVKPNADKSKLRVGDEVTVYYLPRNPNEATIGDPRYLLLNELISIGLAATIVPTLLIWGLLIRKRASRTGHPRDDRHVR